MKQTGADQRARAKGAQAGLDGLKPKDNPYQRGLETELRRHWEEMRAKVTHHKRELETSMRARENANTP